MSEMKIEQAIEIVGEKIGSIGEMWKKALVDEDTKIELVNFVLDQYYDTSDTQQRMIDILGEEVISCIVKWANKKAIEQDYIVMQLCLKADLDAENEKED